MNRQVRLRLSESCLFLYGALFQCMPLRFHHAGILEEMFQDVSSRRQSHHGMTGGCCESVVVVVVREQLNNRLMMITYLSRFPSCAT